MTRVSLAILTYQQEALIEETLRSALAQEVDGLEILVCDDGSTDRTVEVARHIAGEDPRVRFIIGEHNGGIPANATRALQACQGEFIALMAGDDLIGPDKISRQLERLEANPSAAVCYHNVTVFDDQSGSRRLFHDRMPPLEGGPELLLRHGNFVPGSSVMFRASKVPRSVPAWAGLCHDYYLNFEAALGGPIIYVEEVLGKYRKHPGGVTASTDLWGGAAQMWAHVERGHPVFLPHVRHARGHMYRNLARRDSNPVHKRAYARAALQARKRWPWRDLRWLLLASFGLAPSQRR